MCIVLEVVVLIVANPIAIGVTPFIGIAGEGIVGVMYTITIGILPAGIAIAIGIVTLVGAARCNAIGFCCN